MKKGEDGGRERRREGVTKKNKGGSGMGIRRVQLIGGPSKKL